jgi:hypothetical protein
MFAELSLHFSSQIYKDAETSDPMCSTSFKQHAPLGNAKLVDVAFEVRDDHAKAVISVH